ERVGHHELVVPDLVAAEIEPGAVVALHQDADVAQLPREARQLIERRRQVREGHPREPVGRAAEFLGRERLHQNCPYRALGTGRRTASRSWTSPLQWRAAAANARPARTHTPAHTC